MTWPERLNLAIEYIENNLADELDIGEAASIACSSRYHFHRMFFASFDITPGEYIRRRRLTFAAAELASGDERILDIATKYGYNSPNAFTRAFRGMHGINPGKVRSSQVKLSAFNRVTASIGNEGVQMQDYRIVEKPEFRIIGKSQEFEFDKFFKEGPKFWKDFVRTEEYKSLCDLTNGRCGPISEAPLMSVYFSTENDCRDSFTDVLGLEVDAKLFTEEFDVYTIPSATYAEFNCCYKTAVKTNR